MLHLTVLDHTGKPIALKDIATAAELDKLVEQARGLIRDSERMAHEMRPHIQAARIDRVPYN